MKEDNWSWWDVVKIVSGVLVLCYFIHGGDIRFRTGNQGEQLKTDTIYTVYVDTIPYYKPVPKDSVVIRYITQKLPESVPKTPENVPDSRDSAGKSGKNVPDSVDVLIPITQKVYEDSIYTAYVSGYHAQLDSMVFRLPHIETTVTQKMKPKRWSVGVHTGYGIGKNGLSPYIGIGIQYKLWEF